MNRIETVKAQLTIAAALNSTLFYSEGFLDHPENIRDMLLAELEGWFESNRIEAGQFDKGTTIEFVKTLPLSKLVQLLDEMGKNPFSQMMPAYTCGEYGVAVSLWETFVENQMDDMKEPKESTTAAE